MRIRPRIQKAQILAGTLVRVFDLLVHGEGIPTNVFVIFTTSALSGSETLDFTGQLYGDSNYVDTVLVTQEALVASKTESVKLSDMAIEQLTITAGGIAAAETVDITVISW